MRMIYTFNKTTCRTIFNIKYQAITFLIITFACNKILKTYQLCHLLQTKSQWKD